MGLFSNFFGNEKEVKYSIDFEDNIKEDFENNPFLSNSDNNNESNNIEDSKEDSNLFVSNNDKDNYQENEDINNESINNIEENNNYIDDNSANNNIEDNEEAIKKVEFRIENEKEKLLFSIENRYYSSILIYTKDSDIHNSIEISSETYMEFISKFKSVINNWCLEYTGSNDNNKWYLDIVLKDRVITIKGTGDYPDNWNEFIDLIIKYELLYKEKTAIK